jgi:hypothetical protein
MTGLMRERGFRFPQRQFTVYSHSYAATVLLLWLGPAEWLAAAVRLLGFAREVDWEVKRIGIARRAISILFGERRMARKCFLGSKRRRIFRSAGGGGLELRLIGRNGDVDIFEDLARGDAKNSVGEFDEVIALAARVLTAQSVRESQAGGKLLGFDEETGAVSDPRICRFHSPVRFLCLVVKRDRLRSDVK